MNPIGIVFAILAPVVVCGWVLVVQYRKQALKYAPGPTPLPLLGNMLQMHLMSPMATINKWADKYGGVILFWLGHRSIVVLSSPEAVHDAMIIQAPLFQSRWDTPHERFGVCDGISFSNGKRWRDGRKLFVQNLMRNMHLQESLICEEIQNLIDSMIQEGQAGKIAVGTRLILKKMAFGIITRMFLGVNLHSIETGKVGEEILEHIDWIIAHAMLEMTPFATAFRHVPFLNFYSKGFERSITRLWAITQEIIEEHSKGLNQDAPRDFLDKLLVLKQTQDVDQSQIKCLVYDAFVAGSDTSSTTLEWFVMFLARYPEVQERIHFEMDKVLGRSRQPCSEDFEKLSYLSAVIMEVIRMRPVVPLAVPHLCTQTTKVCGVTVPEGATVLLNIARLSNDPTLWKNPQEFRPERFLEEEKSLNLKASETRGSLDEVKFIPFGIGRRACAGYPLAKSQVYLAAMLLCHKLRFSFPEGSDVDMSGKVGIVHAPIPFKVHAVPR